MQSFLLAHSWVFFAPISSQSVLWATRFKSKVLAILPLLHHHFWCSAVAFPPACKMFCFFPISSFYLPTSHSFFEASFLQRVLSVHSNSFPLVLFQTWSNLALAPSLPLRLLWLRSPVTCSLLNSVAILGLPLIGTLAHSSPSWHFLLLVSRLLCHLIPTLSLSLMGSFSSPRKLQCKSEPGLRVGSYSLPYLLLLPC